MNIYPQYPFMIKVYDSNGRKSATLPIPLAGLTSTLIQNVLGNDTVRLVSWARSMFMLSTTLSCEDILIPRLSNAR